MGAKRRNKAIRSAVTSILLLLVVVALVGVAVYFINNVTGESTGGDYKTFSVIRGDNTITESGSEILANNEYVRFDVKYTYGLLNTSESKGFNVKVVPAVTTKNNFDFTVNGIPSMFSDEKDLTAAFDVKLYDDYFTINMHDYKFMGDILARLHVGKNVDVAEIPAGVGYFALVVTAYDGQASITINIGLFTGVNGIIIDGGDIVI